MMKLLLKMLLVIDWIIGSRRLRLRRRNRNRAFRAYVNCMNYLDEVLATSTDHKERMWANNERIHLQIAIRRMAF